MKHNNSVDGHGKIFSSQKPVKGVENYKRLTDDLEYGSSCCSEETEHHSKTLKCQRHNKISPQSKVRCNIIVLTIIIVLLSISVTCLYLQVLDAQKQITANNLKISQLKQSWGESFLADDHQSSEEENKLSNNGGNDVVLNRNKRDDGGSRSRNNRRKSGKKRHNQDSQPTTNPRDLVQSENRKEIVAHFVINERHEKVNINEPEIKTGNSGDVIPYWKFSDNGFNYEQKFASLNEPEGTVTVKEGGMYFIYSQITYFDRTGRWSHTINIDDKPFLKCLASEWGIEVDPDTGVHYNTIHQCYTAAVTHIAAGKEVSLQGMYSNRVIHPDSDMSFWGIVKLA